MKAPKIVDRLRRSLAASTVDLPAVAPPLCVSFRVKRWKSPRIAWLNHRFLAGLGAEPLNDEEEAALGRWLLDRYAVTWAGGVEPEDCFSSDIETTMWADRYGDTWGSPHGGSGRCGMLDDGLNAKGIGRTPLVGRGVDWYHAHGFMWLEEALREAVASEVVARTFPYGAVPVLAVIDTGDRIHWGDGALGERRAVVVRPSVWRIGHLQRSVLFGTAGKPESDQYRDEQRVLAVIEAICGGDRERLSERLSRTARRLSVQLGFAAASRLWPGPVHGSNLTLDGGILDFGSFRSVPDWRNHRATDKEPGSRDDLAQLGMILDRLAASLGKRLGGPPLPIADASGSFNTGFIQYFRQRLDPQGRIDPGLWAVLEAHLLGSWRGAVRGVRTTPNAVLLDDEIVARLAPAWTGVGRSQVAGWSTYAEWAQGAASRIDFQPRLVRERLLEEVTALLLKEDDQQIAAWVDQQIETATRSAAQPDSVQPLAAMQSAPDLA